MGNKCSCIATQSTDEAEDALLDNTNQHRLAHHHSQPQEPPPPYQPRVYVLTEEQKIQVVTRLTLIQSLPVGHYHEQRKSSLEKKSEKSDKRECPICMNDYVSGEAIRLLPCMHYYHLRCADDWLLRSPTCPICMQHVGASPASLPLWRGHSRRSSSSSSSTSATAYPSASPSHSTQQTPSPSPPPPPQCTTVEIHHY